MVILVAQGTPLLCKAKGLHLRWFDMMKLLDGPSNPPLSMVLSHHPKTFIDFLLTDHR